MRKIEIGEQLRKDLDKFFKKDRYKHSILKKKIEEISNCSDPNHYKNLRAPLQEYKEVHINTHFILVFKYVEAKDTIFFYKFGHHEDILK